MSAADRPLPLAMGLRGIAHNYDDFHVLGGIDLDVVRGEIVSLVGPSGCGKSTLLRAVVGTHPPNQGQVVIAPGQPEEHAVVGPGPDRGIVYQNYALMPFLTAMQNVAFGPKMAETTLWDRVVGYASWRKLRARQEAEARDLLERLGLGHAADMYPSQMSGGMRQRVAIGQALIMKPAVLLLDEPFGALDEATREELQDLLLGLYQENLTAKAAGEPAPYTIVIVTHELNEALLVGDRVVGVSQYWDWRGAGHEASPGAVVVYDKPVPVYEPGKHRDPEAFREAREEIRRAVFQEDVRQDPAEYRTFWDDLAAGRGEGVLAPADEG